MSRRARRISLAAVGVLAALSPSLAVAAPAPFTVGSSLGGMTVLPHRIHWLGSPSLPAAKVREVDFLIDGRLGWVEHNPPYVFSDDDGAHQGFLVTSWLNPGRHHFTVRAIARDGRVARSTVTARVLPAPAPPRALAGTWRRVLRDTSGAPEPGSAGNPTDTLTPPGAYTMIIEKRWIRHIWPGRFDPRTSGDTGAGWIITSDYTPGGTAFRVYGSVTREPFTDTRAEGGWWCYPDGPSSDYAWSVSGDTLTLAPKGGQDPCGVRGFIWAGRWTRVR